MDSPPDHAVLIALVEEVRGLLDDLAEVADQQFGEDATRFPGGRREGLVFGRA